MSQYQQNHIYNVVFFCCCFLLLLLFFGTSDSSFLYICNNIVKTSKMNICKNIYTISVFRIMPSIISNVSKVL